MSNDFSAINSLISSVLFVTDCIFNKAQFNDFLVAMVGVILDSHFFPFRVHDNFYHKFHDQCLWLCLSSYN